jgi:hypothetical protein
VSASARVTRWRRLGKAAPLFIRARCGEKAEGHHGQDEP